MPDTAGHEFASRICFSPVPNEATDGSPERMDYNRYNVAQALQYAKHRGRGTSRVLVVGCNTGGDCRLFVEAGVTEVVGLDVIESVGSDFSHPRVSYRQASAEQMPFEAGSFDLVHCFATMEHVAGIEAAFREMARVLAPGGIVYSVASPLWNSRNGHHMAGSFPDDEPWIHLRMTRDRIIAACAARGITHRSDGVPIGDVVDYMLDRRFFNMRPARDYVAACRNIADMAVIQNDLALEPEADVPPQIMLELEEKGYSSEEVRAVTHTYIGRKAGGLSARLWSRLGSVWS